MQPIVRTVPPMPRAKNKQAQRAVPADVRPGAGRSTRRRVGTLLGRWVGCRRAAQNWRSARRVTFFQLRPHYPHEAYCKESVEECQVFIFRASARFAAGPYTRSRTRRQDMAPGWRATPALISVEQFCRPLRGLWGSEARVPRTEALVITHIFCAGIIDSYALQGHSMKAQGKANPARIRPRPGERRTLN